MITTQMRTHNRSEMVAVCGTPCGIPYSNSNMGVRINQKLLAVEINYTEREIVACHIKQSIS
jgi:hypothetical protein